MPKNASNTAEQPGANVVPIDDLRAGPPAHLRGSGRGVSQRAEDRIVPMLTVLQPMSPQVDRQNPAFVEGAEPGAMLLKTSPIPIVKQGGAILFQQCYFSRHYVEWKPREQGGGFVARHDAMPEDVREVPFNQNDPEGRKRFVRPRGTEVIDTRYHVGNVIMPEHHLVMPFVIPFSSTGHTVSRTWHNFMNNARLADGSLADSWQKLYRLTTRRRQNAAGTWFIIEPTPDRWVTAEEDEIGLRLFESLSAGEKVLGDEEDATHETAPRDEKAPF